jgi:polyvinyl alcohol dehydrogenase (cytochrome)
VAIDEERGMAYVGTGQAYQPPAGPLSDALIALRLEDGEIEWSTQFTENDVFTSMNPRGPDYDVGAAPNLFAIGDRDVVGVGDKAGKYHVLDREDGEVVWSVPLTPGSNNGGVMASAAYHDGVIYVASNDGTSGRIAGPAAGPAEQTTFALDAEDGDVLWETTLAPATFGAVSYANGVVYVPTIDGALHALDAENGDVLFEQTKGTSAAGGPTVANGMLFVAQGWAWIPSGNIEGSMTAYALPEED